MQSLRQSSLWAWMGIDGRSEILAFPDGEGRMGWGTKGPKQIRTELFSLFLVKLPPPRREELPFTLLRQEKTCYTRTSPNFNFLVFFEFLIEFLVGFPD